MHLLSNHRLDSRKKVIKNEIMYLNVLRRFYNLLSKRGVQFAFSADAKNVASRYAKGDKNFGWVKNEMELHHVLKICNQRELYLHLYIPPQSRGAVFDLLVIDIDSKANAALIEGYYRNYLNEKNAFINKTPNGIHLYFKNTEGVKIRLTERVLNIGVLADVFTRGFITFYGPGYDLMCVKSNPLTILDLEPRPPLLRQSPQKGKKRPFIVNRQLLSFVSSTPSVTNDKIYLQQHFNLNSFFCPKSKFSERVLEDAVTFF